MADSQIYGTLESNGQVFLINPNGILIGPDAVINTSAFVASLLDADNTEFLNAGDMTFAQSGDPDAGIFLYNYGTITASEGDVVLLGYQVVNQGTINAESGTCAVGAGVEIVLQPSSSDNRIVIVPHSAISQVPIGVEDGSQIAAIRAELAADGNAYELAIKHDGWIDTAGSLSVDAFAKFTAVDGSTLADGVVTAINNSNFGGKIAILGVDVEVGNSGSFYASGNNGGGEIYIGGGWGGNDPDLMNATNTAFAGSAVANADAVLQNNGGTVVVWANEDTTFAGTITAMGGSVSGDGGNVEISGLVNLTITGSVDVSSPTGSEGVFAMDPENLIYNPREVPGIKQATPILITRE
jgi:hypothetical protein